MKALERDGYIVFSHEETGRRFDKKLYTITERGVRRLYREQQMLTETLRQIRLTEVEREFGLPAKRLYEPVNPT